MITIKYFIFSFINFCPANICLVETSWRGLEDVHRLHLQKTNKFTLVMHLQKASSRCPQYLLIKTTIFVLVMRLRDVFKTFIRQLQDVFKAPCSDVFKTSCKSVLKMSWKQFQDVLKMSWRHFEDILKTCRFWKQNIFKTSSRCIIKLECSC